MSQKALYCWSWEVAKRMPHLTKPQAFVLAAFSLGVALARSCTLRAVAEALPKLGKPSTLSFPRLSWPMGAQALARWILSSLGNPCRIVLLVEETPLKDRLKVRVVSRALPLIPGPWLKEN